jgi:hypothetical protein
MINVHFFMFTIQSSQLAELVQLLLTDTSDLAEQQPGHGFTAGRRRQ